MVNREKPDRVAEDESDFRAEMQPCRSAHFPYALQTKLRATILLIKGLNF